MVQWIASVAATITLLVVVFGAALVAYVCRRRRREDAVGALRARQLAKSSIVVLPSIAKLSSVTAPFDAVPNADGLNAKFPSRSEAQKGGRLLIASAHSQPGTVAEQLPVVARGRKVSQHRDVYNRSTPELLTEIERCLDAVAEQREEDASYRQKSQHITKEARLQRLSRRQSGASELEPLSEDVDLETDDAQLDSAGDVDDPNLKAGTAAKPSEHQSTASPHGFLCYSVCLAEGKAKKQISSKGRHGGGSTELHVAVVSAVALRGVGKAAQVFVQVELVSADTKLRSPAQFVQKKSAVRHTKAVMRGGQAVGSGGVAGLCTASEEELRTLVLEQWRKDAEGQDVSDSSQSILSYQWPYHEDLTPFISNATSEQLEHSHLRFTVWARELVPVTTEIMADRPARQTMAGGGDMVEGIVRRGSHSPLVSSPVLSRAPKGSVIKMVQSRMRRTTLAPKPKCWVRQVGEVIVPLSEFSPLSTSHTRTDQLAAPLTEEELRRLYERHHSVTSVYNPHLCMPGCITISLTYWQWPEHSLSVCITDTVTLPRFMDAAMNKPRGECRMDAAMNKPRDTALKIYLDINGQRYRECSSIIAHHSHTPNYALREVLSLSNVSLDRDTVELVIAVKLCRSGRRLRKARSRTFAVRSLRLGSVASSESCRQHWTRVLSQPAQVITSRHSLEMDTERLSKAAML
eukprot:scpid52351/ scgid1800/ 